MGENGGLPSMGSHRVGHDRSDLSAAAAAACFHNVEQWGEHSYLLWKRGKEVTLSIPPNYSLECCTDY